MVVGYCEVGRGKDQRGLKVHSRQKFSPTNRSVDALLENLILDHYDDDDDGDDGEDGDDGDEGDDSDDIC